MIGLHGLSLELTGWFQIAWSADIAAGQLIPLHYFGRDLVAYRSRSGDVRVHDRHCRHLGASLAHGGAVVDDGIQCPFHGWVWGPDGRNVSIPYQDRPNRARRLGTWPVTERNEAVYIWHDAEGREPFWEVPDALAFVPHGAAGHFHGLGSEARSHHTDLKVHPQMVAENSVDPHHFRFVHNTPISPVVLEEQVTGPIWRARVGFGSGWSKHRYDEHGNLRADTLNTLEIIFSGLGVSANLEHTADGLRGIAINTTPVDDETSEIFASYWIQQHEGDQEDGSYQRRLDGAKQALPDDIEIWNHQIFLDPPALATEEGKGFRRMRRWADQFYPNSEAPLEATIHA
jgi:3-ketosteroid 9alpha-monooxygenase subunit A